MLGFLSRLIGRRAGNPLENPANPLSDPDWEDDTGSSTGVRVSRDTLLTLSAYWKGISLISNAIGKTPLEPIETQTKAVATDHQAYDLLTSEAVPFGIEGRSVLASFQFRRLLTQHAISHGNGYAYIERQNDEPVALVPLMPDRTAPVRESGRLWYVTSVGGTFEDSASGLARMYPEDVIHICGMGFDGLCGYSLIQYAAEASGLALAQQTYASKYFANSAATGVVLEVPKLLSDVAYARLKQSWTQMRNGLSNAHRAAILEEETTAKTLSNSAQDAQLVESRKLSLVDIANFLCLPVHKVGGEGRTAYASLTEENQSVLDDAFDPWMETWESELDVKLRTEQQKRQRSHCWKFDRKQLIRQDLGKRADFYRAAVGGPFLERDEARAELGYEKIDAGLLTPGNMVAGTEGMQADQRSAVPERADHRDDEQQSGTALDADPHPDGEVRQLSDQHEQTGQTAEHQQAVETLARSTVRRMAKRLTNARRKAPAPWAEESHQAALRDALGPIAILIHRSDLIDCVCEHVETLHVSEHTPDAIADAVVSRIFEVES